MSAPRILFSGGGTGGHLYPALALGEAVRRLEPSAETFFVGALRGVEARVLPEKGVAHALLPLEPIRRARPWENWRLLPSMARSLAGLRRVFAEFRPDVVVGTGGYASGPAVAYALLRGIPAAVQEQNSYPGFVTRTVAGRVRQIHLAFPEARRHFKAGARTEVFEYGNPIVPPDRSRDPEEAFTRFGLLGGNVCLVMGGSQGSLALNAGVLAGLRALVARRVPDIPDLEILWATGPAHYERVRAALAELGNPAFVRPVAYIDDMPAALSAARFAVSRAGAMASAELCAWGIPTILVPLPTAAANHQHHNAVALRDAGAAILVEERELEDPARLWGEMRTLATDDARRAEIAARALARGEPDAAERIARELLRLAGGER
jgi:UDP-N-acetylglucosamine--N-acetylmuramyl-(pentapeptide) pyrophosphoryl-undecaprenol N-acetylglucosamine transferase